MTRTISEHIAIRKAGQRAYHNRRVIAANEVSELHVTKNRRSVRLTVIVHVDKLKHGAPDLTAGTGFADLDDAQVDRLVRRLTNIRGGKRRSQTRNGHPRGTP